MRLVCLSKLEHEIEKLNRRARKLGLPEIAVTETGREKREIRREDVDGTPMPTGVYETWVKLDVTGESPKLEGWNFLGTLDHSAGDTIVRNAPGCEIPAIYWSEGRKGICDHCGTNRRRKETFIVKHAETGETKQVGRQCVADFLGGKSVEQAIWLATYVRRLGEILDDDYDHDYEGGNLWREPVLFDANKALAIAVRVVNEHGFVSRRDAEARMCPSTSDRMTEVMWPPKMTNLSERERKEIMDEIKRCTPQNGDVEKAAAMREWLAGLDASSSSYVFNLQAIAKREMVQPKELGFLASLVPFYFRQVENPDYQKKERVPSEHIGKEGERTELEVECVGIGATTGQYGEVTIYRMKCGDNKVTWFASAASEIEIGGKYKVKATIKRHDEYRNEKVTLVNRVKVLAEVKQEEKDEADEGSNQ